MLYGNGSKIIKNKIKMTSRDFAYWLQGYFEIQNPTVITEDKVVLIKQHLNLVFKHEIDPSMGNAEHQAELNQIHSPHLYPGQTGGSNDGLMRC